MNVEDRKDSLELKRSVRGIYSWSETIYGDSIDEIVTKAITMDKRVRWALNGEGKV